MHMIQKREQTDRQINRQANTDKQIEKQTNRQTDRQTYRQTDRQIDREERRLKCINEDNHRKNGESQCFCGQLIFDLEQRESTVTFIMKRRP